MPPGPCYDFQSGRCRRGARCRFNHDTSSSIPNSPSTTSQQFREDTGLEAACRQWTYMIPRANTISSRFTATAVDTKKFFQTGWNLIESDDAGIRQHVITKLGAETGLAIIKTLTELMDASQKDEIVISIFRDRALPFYRVISHPDVLSSLILETAVDTVYTFLFGPSGRRGLQVFRFTATALSGMVLEHSLSDEEVSIAAITSSLAVLDRLVETNQSAQVIEGFTAVIETISACIPKNLMVPSAQQCLTRIRQRLNIGSSLPLVVTQSTPQFFLSPSFELAQDLPGNLSNQGARHDNDHASIGDIQILPTAQEIASARQEYLPLTGSTQNHLSGLAGLLDKQFRLLREDTVGQLRDAVREEATRLEHPNGKVSKTHQGQQGVRKIIYHNARFSRMSVDRRKGLQVVAEFDQPSQLNGKSIKQREEWWKGSKLLQVDSLVCFLSSDGKIIFLCVCDPTLPSRARKDSDSNVNPRLCDITSLFKEGKRASVLLSMGEYKVEDAVWISTHISASKNRQSLVEFPGVLLPSFQPTLQALQGMSRKLSLPFTEIVAPDLQDSAASVKPPAYATRRGFSFNLEVLAGVPLTLKPGQPFDFTQLDTGSTLDRAQQFAVVQALSTGLALIQGPPGTGKSYTGVAIIKTLLHNREAADLGPIICVCYTNHALDQLLEHLVKDGVSQIIRVGSRSKSDLLQNLTLHHVRGESKPTKTEKHDIWEHNRDIDQTLRQIEDILPWLNNPKSWTNIQAHLMRTHDRHFKELFGKGVDDEGFQEVEGRKYRVVESWLRGASKKTTSNRSVTQLSAIPLRAMSESERSVLHKNWIEQRSAQLTNDLIHALDSYHGSKSALDKCHSELDLRCLREAHVIGVTTSGLARNIELLQRVRAKVMLCEEAGEVLEAHTLTALLPGVEHAILIGDHEQLRPQINSYELQHDSPRGKRYSLDISLFERLVKPQMGNFQVPLSTLKTQRRMHPSISELVRVPLYPDLQDHPLVSEYPQVDGMRDRLYWLDHQEREDPRPANAVSLSRTNTFEVDMIAALVSHLVRQGTYGCGDIAVITPYLGQLQKIKKRLSNSFEIVVGDRDQEDLEVHGLQDDPETSIDGQVQVQKTTLLNALRIATVDNFQGEEAKVIVISLVRSNDERKCGFLKTSNRINVLLSRARHGMFIIGNSDTSRPVPMWAKVLSILERSNNIGPKLALCCPRHVETSIEVSVPDDFARLAPEGGCAKRCSSRLLCGHSCPNMCHSKSLHTAVRCLERCPRTKEGCEHECPRPCGDLCEPKCQVILFDISLPCGHVAKQLRCHEAQTPAEVRCQVQMEQVMEHCKHKIRASAEQHWLADTIACMLAKIVIPGLTFARPSVEDHTQPAVIAANLHAMVTCPVLCVQSPVKSVAIIQNAASFVTSLVRHVLRIVLGLVHIVDGAYYRVQYPVICSHAHSAAQMFWLAGIDVRQFVGIAAQVMDGHMSMSDFYTMNGEGSIVDLKNSAEPFSASGMKSCPTCRGPLRNLNRYSRIVRRALIDEATKKFIVWANVEFIPLVTRMHAIEAELRETIGGSRKDSETASPLTPFSEPLQLKGTLDQQISLIGNRMHKESRYIKIIGLRREIKKFLQQVNEKEQPFGRIYDLVQDARRHRGININLQSKVDVLQVRSRILTTVLLIRCDYTILLTFLNDQKGETGAFSPSTQVDFTINRKECEQLIEESDTRYQPGNYVEGLLYWARFFALERSFVKPGSELTQLFHKAIGYLQLAHDICDEYPGQTAGMKNEVEGVEKMLRDSTFYMPVSNEEKAAVYAAMAHDFRGTGHWYYCENGHPFTIGECGMPMETSQCPQCGSPVGGHNHQAISSVRPATDLELQFGGVRI
ncbi:hypothetical protein BTUL_0451g00010 [Botrytis tulipae]|uniref:Uncharacterized protein n=1 Tax=Botrytis tulipae TaxID=87230 RepID=A0A4Z1EBT2_9HELO|nr:hypothetical protein BTUL_0451g00010 [Botrytis tulipae]